MDDKENLSNLHAYAMDCFQEAVEGWADIRTKALEDLQFFNGEQWSPDYLRQARLKKAPALTENRLPVFISQVENALRQQEISITAGALDEMASDETAEIFTGLIRSIEMDSRAKSQYIHAAGRNGAMVPGFGFLKAELVPTYLGSTEYKIQISAVRDPFKVLCDPSWMEPDASDATYWFEFEDYTEKNFARLFPKAQFVTSSQFDAVGASSSMWLPGNCIRVARFWYKEELTKVTYLLEDGTLVEDLMQDNKEIPKYELDEENSVLIDLEDGSKQVILRNREVLGCRVKYVDLTGAEILDEGEYEGDIFPYVLVPGTISIINGNKSMNGMITYAKDSQVMLNYLNVSMAKRLASSNKAPWLLTQRQIKGEGIKKLWDAAANGEELGYLVYNDIDEKGQPIAGAPIRADQTAQIQDLVVAAQAYEDKLKSTLGIYDAGLGATPNEQSGVAIKTLAQQGQNANYHFSDNLVRALQQMGRILINLIPKVYSGPQAARIIDAEGNAKGVLLNQIFQEAGQEKAYILDEGVYGVTVNVGPAHANAKQAAIEQMLELARANPNIVPYIQDLIAGAMDFPGKEIVAARLKRVLAMTAPQVIEGSEEEMVPPQVLAQMTQLQQQLDAVTQQAQELALQNQQMKQIIDSKQMDHQGRAQVIALEAEANAQLEMLRKQHAIEQAKLTAFNNAARTDAEMEMKRMAMALEEQRNMMNLILQAVKQFGPAADEVLANVIPSATQTIQSS